MSIEPSIKINEIINEVEKVIVGKRHVVKLSLTALLAGGHVLLEDVPGVGKTMMVRTLSKTIGVSFKRIQFTPDLLPADVTGVSISILKRVILNSVQVLSWEILFLRMKLTVLRLELKLLYLKVWLRTV